MQGKLAPANHVCYTTVSMNRVRLAVKPGTVISIDLFLDEGCVELSEITSSEG